MKKKLMIIIACMLIVWVFFANEYVKSRYHMSILHWLSKSNEITDTDRFYLQNRGPIIYAADNNSPPLRFVDEDTGLYQGVVVDYISALSIELGVDIEMQPMIWEDALDALAKGDTTLCDMYPSKKRSEVYLFSDPVYYQRGILVVPNQAKEVKSVKDLSGMRVALQKGDYVYDFMKAEAKGIIYVFTQDYEASIDLLETGQVDAIAGDEPVISYFLSQLDLSDNYRIVDQPLYELPSVLSMPKNDVRLQMIINKGIYALNQKNTIDKIQQKWFGISTPISNNNDSELNTLIVITVVFIAFIAVLMAYIWNGELKRHVDERTRALAINENNLKTIIDSLSHVIVVIGMDFTIWSYNKAFADLFLEGAKHDHLSLTALFPGFNDRLKIMFTKPGASFDYVVKGKTFNVGVYAIEYAAFDGPARLLMLEDISEKRINEMRMNQENKMAAIGQLATGVAHEIRNPLGLIRNYAFIAKRTPNDQKLLGDAFEVIEESVDKASAIIDNLLNFSRLSDDTASEVRLDEVIKIVLDLNQKLMGKQQVTCQTVLSPVRIKLLDGAFKHVLMNLVNNSLDAMPKAGNLTLWLWESPNHVHLHVIDTGLGMTEETKRKMFDPFFTTKGVGEGTGLGMYIVYNELNKLGGKLDVVSKPGSGTTIKLILPKEVTHG